MTLLNAARARTLMAGGAPWTWDVADDIQAPQLARKIERADPRRYRRPVTLFPLVVPVRGIVMGYALIRAVLIFAALCGCVAFGLWTGVLWAAPVLGSVCTVCGVRFRRHTYADHRFVSGGDGA